MRQFAVVLKVRDRGSTQPSAATVCCLPFSEPGPGWCCYSCTVAGARPAARTVLQLNEPGSFLLHFEGAAAALGADSCKAVLPVVCLLCCVADVSPRWRHRCAAAWPPPQR